MASQVQALGNRGGFSGARLWRCTGLAGAFCLRAWPEHGSEPAHVGIIHQWMRSAGDAGLLFVPTVMRTVDGATCISHAGRLWDVTSWMPGQADFHARPTPARIAAACTALGRLHVVWQRFSGPAVPCPAVGRRLKLASLWTDLVRSGWQPDFGSADAGPVRPWAEQAWRILQPSMAQVATILDSWKERAVPIQPCLCDVWHDHVLFGEDVVTGLIDYGSAKLDHVAVDLARLLGSLAESDRDLWSAGLAAYRAVRALTVEEERLVDALDRTGTLLGAANWLMWIYREGRPYEDPALVARRLATLVRRLNHLVATRQTTG
jgi:Ser/Thr protein kinase RdoA (MazF antagonist)